jgi:hypothetical protein
MIRQRESKQVAASIPTLRKSTISTLLVKAEERVVDLRAEGTGELSATKQNNIIYPIGTPRWADVKIAQTGG